MLALSLRSSSNYFTLYAKPYRCCHSVFGIHKLIKQDKPEHFKISPIVKETQPEIIDIVKRFYLAEHVFFKSRDRDLRDDHAVDEYLLGILKQGNSLYARTKDGEIAGVCINYITSPIDVYNLRNFAYYRQDPTIKDFLYFMAKLDETPNLWTALNQQKIFEIKMLTVIPEFRRQGLAVLLAEKSKEHALDEGHKYLKLNCINNFDYKIAENCMMRCIAKFPLHKLRSTTSPYIKRDSEYNKILRVYITILQTDGDMDKMLTEPLKICQVNLDDCLE